APTKKSSDRLSAEMGLPPFSQRRGGDWRAASYIRSAAATETLRLSTAPYIGIATSSSQAARVPDESPRPSPPSTSATGGTSRASKSGRAPSASAPTTRTPALLSQRSTLTR